MQKVFFTNLVGNLLSILDAVSFMSQRSQYRYCSAFSCSVPALFKQKIKHSYRILVAKSELLQQEMKHDPECGNTWKRAAWGIKKMLFRG